MVYRVYVEKKIGFDHEASALYRELKSFLGIEALEGVRILNRYDVENIEAELFEKAIPNVFSEPMLDEVYRDMPDYVGTVFAAPMARGSSGATTAKSTPWFAAKLAMPSISVAFMLTHTASCARPALPGRANISDAWGFSFSLRMIACSRPPPPTTMIFMRYLQI